MIKLLTVPLLVLSCSLVNAVGLPKPVLEQAAANAQLSAALIDAYIRGYQSALKCISEGKKHDYCKANIAQNSGETKAEQLEKIAEIEKGLKDGKRF